MFISHSIIIFDDKEIEVTVEYQPEPEPEPETNVPVEGVSLDLNELNLTVGDTQQLAATVEPEGASNKNLTWASDDTGVATVVNGLVRVIGAGTCTITVTTIDGDFEDTAEITVTP